MNALSVTSGCVRYVALYSVTRIGVFGAADLVTWPCTFPIARATMSLRRIGVALPKTSTGFSLP